MIELPTISPISVHSELEFYGAVYNAARYCGISGPFPYEKGYWRHGWTPDHWLDASHPQLFLGKRTPEKTYWVGKKEVAEEIKRKGYPKVKAIGLPIVYLPEKKINRIANSLLVMPIHSLDYTTHKHWKFDEYVQQIIKIRDQFDKVLICIHPSCVEKGYWVKDFERHGFEWVIGAGARDKNALLRIQKLLSSFEYVTTNGSGSHIAYAAFFGAKVSIYGGFTEMKAEDYKNAPAYRGRPGLLSTILELSSEKTFRKNLPELFCLPYEAKQNITWGKQQVGFDLKLSPQEMRNLFNWTPQRIMSHKTKIYMQTFSQSIKRLLPNSIKHSLKLLLSPSYKKTVRQQNKAQQERKRLNNMPRYQEFQTEFLNKQVKGIDGASFLSMMYEIFDKNIYNFSSNQEKPYILDCGANIGMSVIYFKSKYPNAEIIAFEPDTKAFEALGRNVQAFNLENVTLLKKGVWSEETSLSFAPDGADAGRVLEDAQESVDEQIDTIETVRLRDYLDRRVDFLKIDIEGAEFQVLQDCKDDLANVQNLFVEYHSFQGKSQRLPGILEILRNANFRYYIQSIGVQSPQPFIQINTQNGVDLQLNIFAYRD